MPLAPPLSWVHRLYSWLRGQWESPAVQRGVATALLVTFVGALAAIELRRLGVLPFAWLPTNHFHAVRLGFNLLLAVEALGLIFALAGSPGRAQGKQFEILSLILLRQSLKELVHAPEPIQWTALAPFVPTMLADAVGAVAVFALVGLFYRLQREGDEKLPQGELLHFSAAKEAVALVVLVVFLGLAGQGVASAVRGAEGGGAYDTFFDSLYTVLVFADLTIVFLSLRHSFTYEHVFRSSGFAVVTVLIRVALTAPPFVNAALGVGATLLGVGLAAAYPSTAAAPRPAGPAPTAPDKRAAAR